MHRIAETLGVTPDDLDLYSHQIAEYAAYFEWCDTRRDKFDFYLAQLAGYASQKPRFRLREFMAPSPQDSGGQATITAKDAAQILGARYGKP